MRLFYFLARNISYTFAVSFFTVFGGWLASFFGLFLGSAFIFFAYEKLVNVMSFWFVISVLIASLFHYIQFGLLTPLKIPALLKSHRMINKAFKRKLQVGDARLKKVYKNFSYLVMHNTVSSIIYTAVTGLIFVLIATYKYQFAHELTLDELKQK